MRKFVLFTVLSFIALAISGCRPVHKIYNLVDYKFIGSNFRSGEPHFMVTNSDDGFVYLSNTADLEQSWREAGFLGKDDTVFLTYVNDLTLGQVIINHEVAWQRGNPPTLINSRQRTRVEPYWDGYTFRWQVSYLCELNVFQEGLLVDCGWGIPQYVSWESFLNDLKINKVVDDSTTISEIQIFSDDTLSIPGKITIQAGLQNCLEGVPVPCFMGTFNDGEPISIVPHMEPNGSLSFIFIFG